MSSEIIDSRVFLDGYFGQFQKTLYSNHVQDKLIAMREMVMAMKGRGGKLLFAGNGASASIASHCALDFTKQAGVTAMTLCESSLVTAFANDYGYEQWVARALGRYAGNRDLVVLISSSGNSPNLVNAAKYSLDSGIETITLTGFSEANPLKQLGDLNLWVNSMAYNIVECTHMVWLTAVIDLIIGKTEYSVN